MAARSDEYLCTKAYKNMFTDGSLSRLLIRQTVHYLCFVSSAMRERCVDTSNIAHATIKCRSAATNIQRVQVAVSALISARGYSARLALDEPIATTGGGRSARVAIPELPRLAMPLMSGYAYSLVKGTS